MVDHLHIHAWFCSVWRMVNSEQLRYSLSFSLRYFYLSSVDWLDLPFLLHYNCLHWRQRLFRFGCPCRLLHILPGHSEETGCGARANRKLELSVCSEQHLLLLTLKSYIYTEFWEAHMVSHTSEIRWPPLLVRTLPLLSIAVAVTSSVFRKPNPPRNCVKPASKIIHT